MVWTNTKRVVATAAVALVVGGSVGAIATGARHRPQDAVGAVAPTDQAAPDTSARFFDRTAFEEIKRAHDADWSAARGAYYDTRWQITGTVREFTRNATATLVVITTDFTFMTVSMPESEIMKLWVGRPATVNAHMVWYETNRIDRTSFHFWKGTVTAAP